MASTRVTWPLWGVAPKCLSSRLSSCLRSLGFGGFARPCVDAKIWPFGQREQERRENIWREDCSEASHVLLCGTPCWREMELPLSEIGPDAILCSFVFVVRIKVGDIQKHVSYNGQRRNNAYISSLCTLWQLIPGNKEASWSVTYHNHRNVIGVGNVWDVPQQKDVTGARNGR